MLPGPSVHDSLGSVSSENREDAEVTPPTGEDLPDRSTPDRADPDAAETGTPEADLASAREGLEAQLEVAQREAADLKEKWLRAAADLENYRKRAAKEREDIQKFAIERLLRDFLPVYDDLERAVGALKVETEDESHLRQGLDLVRKKFIQQLEKHGVEGFDSVGEGFDPNHHDAIQQAHSNEVEAGRILEELQRGFMLHGRLLRPAMVVVSLGPEQKAE